MAAERLTTEVGKTTLAAKCQTCRWKRDTGNYEADRMAGRRHAEAMGHVVVGQIKRTITWDGRSA
jgi:hypothetical protein